MTKKPTTGKMERKAYTCNMCGYPDEFDTNHYGEIYMTHCMGCGTVGTWTCGVPCPVDMDLPEKWTERNILVRKE